MKAKTLTFVVFLCITAISNGQDYPDEFFLSEKEYIESKILNQTRLMFVYLPNNYYSDTTLRYPVHYVTDAPATSNLYFELTRLHSLGNYIPKCIVVGLSSDNRETLLHPDREAHNYLEFIEKEVIPFIETKYRTEKFRAIAGHSMGAAFTFYTFLKRPGLFDAYIAGSPGPLETIIQIASEKENFNSLIDNKFFFSSIGSKETESLDGYNRLTELFSRFRSEKLDLHLGINTEENHISNISVNYQAGITQLYHDWQFILPGSLEKPAEELLRDHLSNLKNRFGYEPILGEWEVLFPLMDQLAKRGDFKNAIGILNYCIEVYPNSDQAYAFLAMAHFDIGEIEKGTKYLDKALELNPHNQFAQEISRRIKR